MKTARASCRRACATSLACSTLAGRVSRGVTRMAESEVYLPQVGEIAERHPGLRLLVDHYARVRGGNDDAAHGNQPALLALAKYPNVAVKATGAPGNSSAAYPYRNIHKYTEQIFDAFGPQRTFWGTDITRMPCSWRQCVTMFTDEMPFLKGRDLEMVMGRAVCDWIGWKLPA
jgi:hypothetical protein